MKPMRNVIIVLLLLATTAVLMGSLTKEESAAAGETAAFTATPLPFEAAANLLVCNPASANSLRPCHANVAADQLPAERLAPLSFTRCVNGMAGDYPCDGVDLLALVPLSGLGANGTNGADIWGWTHAASGREFALMTLMNGTAFVEISDPTNPVHLGNLPTHTFSTIWRDVKTYRDHAYIVADNAGNHGMQVFDLTQLLTVTNPPQTFAATARYDGFGSAHNVAINEESGFAYVLGSNSCSGGLHMIDISEPADPQFAGCYSADGYTHDTQCVIYAGPDGRYTDREICFNANEDTLTIVDVTDKENPIMLAREGYVGAGYAHQGWLTADSRYFLLNDEGDELAGNSFANTYLWDVSDLENPIHFETTRSTVTTIDHNLYIHDGIAYQANYRSGLRLYDVSDVANGNLPEIGYFDVYPSSDAVAFNGAWSNYPFFPSGSIIVSGIEQGLFVLRRSGPPPELDEFIFLPFARHNAP